VSGTEAINKVADFAHEVLGKGAGFIPETSDYDELFNLWIIRGEVRYMGDYTYLLSHFLEVMNKSSQEFIDVLNNFNLTKKVIGSLKDFKFRFYISSDGKNYLLLSMKHFLILILQPKLKGTCIVICLEKKMQM